MPCRHARRLPSRRRLRRQQRRRARAAPRSRAMSPHRRRRPRPRAALRTRARPKRRRRTRNSRQCQRRSRARRPAVAAGSPPAWTRPRVQRRRAAAARRCGGARLPPPHLPPAPRLLAPATSPGAHPPPSFSINALSTGGRQRRRDAQPEGHHPGQGPGPARPVGLRGAFFSPWLGGSAHHWAAQLPNGCPRV